MDLPKEILIKIFDYVLCNDNLANLLKSVYNVNKQWRAASLSSYILRKIDSSLSKNQLINLAITGYLKCTQELDLSNIGKTLKNEDFKKIFQNIPCLKSLNLSNCPCINEYLLYLANNCPDLEALYLQNFNDLSEKNLDDFNKLFKHLNKILNLCGLKIKILDFSYNYLASFSIIKHIPTWCPNLEELHLTDTGKSKIKFPTESFQKLCPKLKVLRLGPFVSFQPPKGEVPGFKELEVFTTRSNSKFGPENNLKCLLGKSEKLKLLDIKGCFLFHPKALCELPALNIEYLYFSISYMWDTTEIKNVVDKWKHSLKILEISKTNTQSIYTIIYDIESHSAPNSSSLLLRFLPKKANSFKYGNHLAVNAKCIVFFENGK